MRRRHPSRSVLWLSLFLFVVLRPAIAGNSDEAQEGATPLTTVSASFDHFVFARQWPGTLCARGECPLLPPRHHGGHASSAALFTIRGLWPSFSNGTLPRSCQVVGPYDEDLLADLAPQLEEAWPFSLLSDADGGSGGSSAFWAGEWNKHGTCALPLLPSQHKYFERALALHRQFPLLAALQRAGIEPSATRAYARQELDAAIRAAYGAEPQVHCTPKGHVTEIWMCLDLGFRPVDCKLSQGADASCSKVSLPPIPGSGAGAEPSGEQLASSAHQAADQPSATSIPSEATMPSSNNGATASSDYSGASRGSNVPASYAVRQQQRPRRRHRGAQEPDSLARTLCVAAAGVGLAALLTATVATSWARYRRRQVRDRAGGVGGVTTPSHSRSPSLSSLPPDHAPALRDHGAASLGCGGGGGGPAGAVAVQVLTLWDTAEEREEQAARAFEAQGGSTRAADAGVQGGWRALRQPLLEP